MRVLHHNRILSPSGRLGKKNSQFCMLDAPWFLHSIIFENEILCAALRWLAQLAHFEWETKG